jgi:UDP-2,4-diacetamido-2,4,6-trideoxy-beta-L-altropyranose hydrolase
MKVTILTEGSRHIGYGHITRCTSLYQSFEEIGMSCEFIVYGDDTVRSLLTGKNYIFSNWLRNKQLLTEVLSCTDIVLIDSYLADYQLYETAALMVQTAVYFDDDIRLEYPEGFVLNGAVFAEQMLYPKMKDTAYLLGAKYTPLRKEFWNGSEKRISDKVKTVMITLGGADTHNLTPRVLNILADIYPGINKKVIIARSFGNIAEIRHFKNNYTQLIYYPDAAEMKQVMLESDVAITSCGQTLYELARIGVPAIGIGTAGNQLQNIKGWRKCGFLEYAGWYNEDDIERRINNCLNRLSDKKVRIHKAETGKKMIDGRGHIRIINAINESIVKKAAPSLESTVSSC